MATVSIDLDKGYISCLACGQGTLAGTLESPCPSCRCTFDRVQYRRKSVQQTGHVNGRTVFTLLDIELEKKWAVDYIWHEKAIRLIEAGFGADYIESRRQEFCLQRGVAP